MATNGLKRALWHAIQTQITSPWHGTCSDLKTDLVNAAPEHSSVIRSATARDIGIDMADVAMDLNLRGWQLSRSFRGSYRLWNITPPDSTDAALEAQRAAALALMARGTPAPPEE